MALPRWAISHLIFITFFALLYSASSVEILTTSVVDLEIVDWGLKIFALKPNSRERLEKFSVGFQLNYLGEFIDFNFSYPYNTIHLNTSRSVTTRSSSIERGVRVDRYEQKAFLRNGMNFTMRIEAFNATLYRNYFGWKMTLSPKNVKLTYFLDGTDLPTEYPAIRRSTSSYQIGVYATFLVELTLRDDLDFTNLLFIGLDDGIDCNAGLPWTLPVRPCPDQKYTERFDPAVPGDDSILFSTLETYDARVNVTLIQQQNGTATNSSGSYAYDLETFRFLGPEDDEISALLKILTDGQKIYNTPGRSGVLTIDCLVAFRPDGLDGLAGWKSFEYDPDLAVFFSFVGVPPSDAPQTAAEAAFDQGASIAGPVAGAIVAAVVVAVVLTLALSPSIRRKVFPFLEKRSTTLREDTLADEEEDGKSSPMQQHRSSTWTRASKPE